MTSLSQSTVPEPVEALPGAHSPDPGAPQRRSAGKGGVGLTIVLAIVAVVWIAPLALLVITAVRPLADFVGNGPLSWPRQFTWTNFADAWRIGNFGSSYGTVIGATYAGFMDEAMRWLEPDGVKVAAMQVVTVWPLTSTGVPSLISV